MAGIGIGAFALIVVLSAFNGIENLVESLYSSFDPDIKITAVEGKTFSQSSLDKNQLLSLPGVAKASFTIDETVLLKYRDKQSVATIKGVESEFKYMSGLDTMMVEGEFLIENNQQPFAVLGYGISYYLSLFIEHNFEPVKVYAPKRTAGSSSLNPENAFAKVNIMPSGVFSINPDFDNKYVLVPFRFAQELLQYENRAGALEIGLTKGANPEDVKKAIESVVGSEFNVKTRYQLNEIIYKTNNSEKWITFLILSFILLIAAFNLIGSLTMLIIDKKPDILILKSMGANTSDIKKVFLLEGLMISGLGGLIGLVIGALLCLGQQAFGFVKLQGIVVDTYPIQLEVMDFTNIMAVVLFIGFLSSYFPVKYVVK